MALHLLLALSIAAAPDSGGARRVVAAEPPDTTYYVTNRARRNGRFERAIGDSLEYGIVITQFTCRGDSSFAGRLLGGLAYRQVDSVRLTLPEFQARVRRADSAAAGRGEGAVLYVHGFATSFRKGIAQGAEIAHRGRFGGPLIVFAWPGHNAPAFVPSFHALVSRAYREDSATAARSGDAFRTAVSAVLAATRPGTLTVVGHSLGAQLVAEALHAPSPLNEALLAAPLRALVFYAPDIAAARFRDSLAAPIAALAARRIVYASRTDRLLTLSRLVNHSTRAGQAGAAQLLAPADVEIVDVTGGRRAAHGVRRLLDMHHAMRVAGSALYDFFGVVRGRPADCREADGIAARAGERSWRLTSAAIPGAFSVCQAAGVATTIHGAAY